MVWRHLSDRSEALALCQINPDISQHSFTGKRF
jgi:hypothetical protein